MNSPEHPPKPEAAEPALPEVHRRGRTGEGAASALQQLISDHEQRRRTSNGHECDERRAPPP